MPEATPFKGEGGMGNEPESGDLPVTACAASRWDGRARMDDGKVHA